MVFGEWFVANNMCSKHTSRSYNSVREQLFSNLVSTWNNSHELGTKFNANLCTLDLEGASFFLYLESTSFFLFLFSFSFIHINFTVVWKWSPNFSPSSNIVEQLAIWIRISGLSIEYYDHRVFTLIGNRIDKTVKVEKNTSLRERVKYVRDVHPNRSLITHYVWYYIP